MSESESSHARELVMTVRYHVTPGGGLDPCYAKAEPCPCREHHDFFNDDSAIAWKIASKLSAVDPSNRGLKDLMEAAEAGKQIAFEQIAYAVETRGVSLNRTRVGIASVRRLSTLLYRMGRTFDALNTDRASTEEFVRTGDPTVLASKSDYELLADLSDASEFVMNTDWSQTKIDAGYAVAVNARLRRSASLRPGVMRTVAAYVNTTLGRWKAVGRPSPDSLQAMIAAAQDEAGGDIMDRAVGLFCEEAKMQPFSDGNKRTALLVANAVALKETEGEIMVSVPADDVDAVKTFTGLLSRWYVHDDPSIKTWLAEWNRQNPIDD